jgi:hypothetical protein
MIIGIVGIAIGALAVAGINDCRQCAIKGLYAKSVKYKDNRGGYGPPFWMNEAQKEFWWKTHLRGGHTRRGKPLNPNVVRKSNIGALVLKKKNKTMFNPTTTQKPMNESEFMIREIDKQINFIDNRASYPDKDILRNKLVRLRRKLIKRIRDYSQYPTSLANRLIDRKVKKSHYV